ncbi:MAG: SURF1 family protein [Pelagimonas sp.]|nr:SURF1 family protein [Pelagimonas sp.]
MTRLIAPLFIGLFGAAILIWLGSWQMQRLEWKQGILSEIDSTISGEPQGLPQAISPTEQRYLPVSIEGAVEGKNLYVLVSRKNVGAGWRVISAFQTSDGRRLLLDRGFIPHTQKSTQLYSGQAQVLGNMHWPDDRNSSTPENDLSGNTWFARDLAQMADVLKTAPVLVVARSMTPADTGVTPLPVDSAGIPNDHLHYAITWFSLAVVWLFMTGVWIWRRLTGKDD